MLKHFAIICIFATAALAQISLPGRRSVPPAKQTDSQKTITTTGMLRRLSSREIIIETSDHRIVWYRIGDTVRFDSEKFHRGDQLKIASVEDDQGNYTATAIEWISTGTSEDRAAAELTWDLPGGPAAEHVRTIPQPARMEDATIKAARAAAEEFIGALPNFAVRRSTTRYVMEGPRSGWRTIDLVSANLIYRDGKEEYTDIKIDNKPTNKSMADVGGLRSAGEFGSILVGLFNPGSGTEFARPSQVELRGRKAYVYKFEISRERSEWRISTPSQLYFAAYGGAVWIDATTNRVLSIEMQARNLPKTFPLDTIETTLDYEFVRLDTAKQFLLPTESEALNCIRETNVCMKNTTSFRNYVKFESDSRIIFDDNP